MKIRVALTVLAFCLPLGPFGVSAQPQTNPDDQSACMMDAQTICGQFIPDREKVAQCLMSNRNRISPACREALKHWK